MNRPKSVGPASRVTAGGGEGSAIAAQCTGNSHQPSRRRGATVKTGCSILVAFLPRVNTGLAQTCTAALFLTGDQALGQRTGRISGLSSCSALCATELSEDSTA